MMEISLKVGGQVWQVDLMGSVELAVPLDFQGAQPRAFGMPPARAKAVEGGDFIGDRRRGGSVNCEVLELIPHGNGTHTEGVGHITKERISVGELEVAPLMPAVLLSVGTRRLGDTSERYGGVCEDEDRVICRADLVDALDAVEVWEEFLKAVVIRVERSESFGGPMSDFSSANPPYFTDDAMKWLREIGCEHLLVELPSVDREEDGGTLPNHHLFFGIAQDEMASEESRIRTITELIEVPEYLSDGRFALALQVPRFIMDAAPSRPILYPLDPLEKS